MTVKYEVSVGRIKLPTIRRGTEECSEGLVLCVRTNQIVLQRVLKYAFSYNERPIYKRVVSVQGKDHQNIFYDKSSKMWKL